VSEIETPLPDGAEPASESERPPLSSRGALRSVWDWTRSVLIAFVLFLLIRTFLVEAFKIPTSSMEGTLLVGDFLLVNKVVYGAEVPGTHVRLPAIADPMVGDVIVFNPPHDPSKNYVKRVVGGGGDTLEMRRKVLYRNGIPIDEPYAAFEDRGGSDPTHPDMSWQVDYLVGLRAFGRYRPSRDNWGPLLVPETKLFVLGDNRDNSEDSRYWGFVDREAVRGRPWFVYYSFNPDGSPHAAWMNSVRWDRIGGLIH
jgi:signal peptidase I